MVGRTDLKTALERESGSRRPIAWQPCIGRTAAPVGGWCCPVSGKWIDRRDGYRMVTRIAKVAGIPRHISPHSLRLAAITNALDAATSTATGSTSSLPTSLKSESMTFVRVLAAHHGLAAGSAIAA